MDRSVITWKHLLKALRADHPSMKYWMVAAALALGWHGLWWLWVGVARTPPVNRVPAVPEVTYAPFSADRGGDPQLHADVRVLWSPALFSLSSPVGFSRILLDHEIGVRPILNPPNTLSNLLERLAQSGTGQVIRLATPVDWATWKDRAPEFGPLMEDPWRAPDRPAQGREFRVELLGGLKDAEFRNLQFPRNNPLVTRSPWEARAYVEFNEAGVVRHVFLDQPTTSKKLNQLILRQLLALRIKDPRSEPSGYIRMRYAGVEEAMTASESRGAP